MMPTGERDLRLPACFFGAALLYALVVFLLLPLVLPEFAYGFYAPHQLALVHLGALGWITLTAMGATYQLLPVLLGTSLRGKPLAYLSALLLPPSVLGLAEGLGHGWMGLVALSGVLLWSGIIAFLVVVWRSLLSSPKRDEVAWHIGLATLFLAIAATLGATLAFNKGGNLVLGGALLPTLTAHIALMIGGWLSLLLAGVSTRLVAMFTLTEDIVNHRLLRVQLLLLSSGIGGLALAWGWQAPPPFVGLAMTLILAGALCLLWQLSHLYRNRRRRLFDIYLPFGQVALLFGGVALLILVSSVGQPVGARGWIIAGWLLLAGWLGTAVQGFFYKIASFLLWLHRYAPRAARQPTPRLETLYHRPLAMTGLLLWGSGVLLVALALSLESAEWTRLAALPATLGGVLWLANIIRIFLPHSLPVSPTLPR